MIDRGITIVVATVAICAWSHAAPNNQKSLRQVIREADEVRVHVRDLQRGVDWVDRSAAVLSATSNARLFRELKALTPHREPGSRSVAEVKLVFVRRGKIITQAPFFPSQRRFGGGEEWWHVSPQFAAWIGKLQSDAGR